ncbi:hypothetical protein ACFLXJ_03195 [Chloroflexota bacterium]
MIIIHLIFTIGSFASLFGLFFLIRPRGEPLTSLQSMLLGVGICFMIAAITFQVWGYRKRKPKSMKKESQIRSYMYNWIFRGGKVAILSNDMSWVRDDEMRELLRSKANNNELYLCLPREISLSRELEQEGAKIHTYPELQYVPKSRFTIRNIGRTDEQVAVGRKYGETHVIEEFSMGEHPIFSVADDLINVIIKFDEWKRQQRRER